MDQGKLYSIIEQVTKGLTPASLKILDTEDEVLTIRVVADAFSNTPMVKRFKLLADLFEREAPELAASYTLVFEAWTSAEAQDPEIDQEGRVLTHPATKRSRAAKDIEI